jgi:hypothetical protein
MDIESRHSSYLRAVLEELPAPTSFDIPLTSNEVITLASPFIASCPPGNALKPQLTFQPHAQLVLSDQFTGQIRTGDWIVLNTPDYTLVPDDSEDGVLYAAFLTLLGPVYAEAYPIDDDLLGVGFRVQVPGGLNGQNYVVITQCQAGPLTDAQIAAGPAIVEITNRDLYERYTNTPANPDVST